MNVTLTRTGGTHVDAVLTPGTLDHPLVRDCPHLYCGPRWLRVEEQAHPGDAFYTWARTGDSTAFAPAYGFDRTSNPWPFARPDLFLADVTGTGEGHEALLPAFTVGGRRPGRSKFCTAGSVRQRARTLTLLLEAAAEGAVVRGAACLAALYCPPGDADLVAAFRAHGGVRFPSHGANILGLPGDGLSDWMASLPRKQRAKEKADLRKLDGAGVEFTVSPLREPDIDRIVPLELGLYDKYGHAYAREEAVALHRAYLDHLGDDALLVRARRDGADLGFVSLVRHGPRLHVRQAGFHPQAGDSGPVYFGAALHEPVRWAYAHGVRHLDLSVGSDAVKRRRGARTHPRDAWFVPLTEAARRHLRHLTERAGEDPAPTPATAKATT
ncbi:GNAT family N-acetyltransferase [Streptomyces sp. NPDC001744]|uniref:GNAT family N-acetyltransferase n=1 Tax=Streptomyces sp. NPDC001744 TaxID=3364606 RepID=UPI0036BA2772